MKKLISLGIFMLIALLNFSAKAQINFDLTTVGGTIVMGYDAVNTERNKVLEERWISVANFAASGTAGVCAGVTRTFDIRLGRTIDFFLAKCDRFTITANVATGRGLRVNIDNGPNIDLAGMGFCHDYVIPVNSEVPVRIRVQGQGNTSAWTSLFTFFYEPKMPKIDAFKINGIDAVIDHLAKTITLELPFGTNINNVLPQVTLGGTATSYSPAIAQDFTAGPVVYTATDGSVNVNYTANITVKATPDTEKTITALTINGKAASIDQATGIISCVFASFEGPLATWPVVFMLNSITATASFTSGSSHDFATQGTLVITVTAQDGSTKQYSVIPTVSNKKNVGILSVQGRAEAYDNLFLSAFDDYMVHHLLASNTAPSNIQAFYANYDLVVLHANVSGTNATAVASKEIVGIKPVLNMKVFFYNPGRWNWSSAAPQNAAAGTASANVEPRIQSHPIFRNVTFNDMTLTFYDNLPAGNGNSIQFTNDLNTLDKGTSHTIATVGASGIQMHEIQDNLAAKYLLVGLSMENNNYNFFNSNTINILRNSAEYLMNPTAKFDYLTSDTHSASANRLFFSNGAIHNPANERVSVYSVSGTRLFVSDASIISAENLPRGVYIIRTDKMQSFKLIR